MALVRSAIGYLLGLFLGRILSGYLLGFCQGQVFGFFDMVMTGWSIFMVCFTFFFAFPSVYILLKLRGKAVASGFVCLIIALAIMLWDSRDQLAMPALQIAIAQAGVEWFLIGCFAYFFEQRANEFLEHRFAPQA